MNEIKIPSIQFDSSEVSGISICNLEENCGPCILNPVDWLSS